MECYLNGPVVGKTGGGYYLNTVSRVKPGAAGASAVSGGATVLAATSSPTAIPLAHHYRRPLPCPFVPPSPRTR